MPPEWAGQASEPIHSPALSIYGATTPEQFYTALSGHDVANGFLNRFLLISTRRKPAERDPKLDPFEVPEAIRDALHALYGSGSASLLYRASSNGSQADAPMVTVPWGPEARAAYQAFGRQVEAREAEAGFLGRTVEMALRIATIRAVGISPAAPVVTLSDMEWARDLAMWSAERMMMGCSDYMAENENQAQAQRVLRIVRERGEIKHGDLLRALQHQMRARDLKDLLAGLEEAGQLEVRRAHPPQGGTETRWYSAPASARRAA